MRPSIAAIALTVMVGMAASLTAIGQPKALDDALTTLRVSNDRLEQFALPNGMVCLLKADHSAPVVSIQVWVGTGSIHEQEYLGAGLSHAIEHMIFKGTPTRAPGDITREINNAGGRINAYTTLDRVVFLSDLPSRHWRVGFDAIADSVMHANFPAEEWEQERKVILREFAMGKDDPGRVLNKLLWRTAFRKHPYRYPVIGHEDIFNSVTRDDLAEFFKRHYVSDNITLVIVGDVDPAEVRSVVEETFAPFTRRPRAPVVLPTEPRPLAPRIVRETGPYKVSRLSWAYHSVALDHPDAAALDVLANIAGQGRSSRFVKSLVEEQNLAHSVSVWSYTPGQPGLFGISATFDPDKEEALLAGIAKELQALQTGTFTERELQKSRRSVLSSSLASLATMKGQADDYGSGQFFAGDPRFSETYIRQLQEVTPEGLSRVANHYLLEKTRTVVLLTPDDSGGDASRRALAAARSVPRLRTLENGIRLIVREDHKLPFVYITASLQGGLLSEDEASVGITAMMSELLVRGTASRSRDEIAETVESLGGHLSAYSGYNSFGLKAKGMSCDAATLTMTLADCLINPVFPKSEIETQRTRQIAAIKRQEERPMFLAGRQLRKSIFGDHPYRWDRQGTVASVESLTASQLRAHHARHLLTGNLVISVFGDIMEQEAIDLVTDAFANVPRGALTRTAHERPPVKLPVRIEQEQPHQQAIVLAGFPGVSLHDPRIDALEILQTAMSGLASDLSVAVRSERGLAYYVGAYQQPGLEPGMFVIYGGTRREAADAVAKLYREEIERLVTEGLREEELTRAKRQIIADHEMQLQDNLSVALSCGLNELYGLGYDHLFTAADRIDAVTGDAIREAAAAVLNTNRMAESILLPASAGRGTE
jgi:zinc protease